MSDGGLEAQWWRRVGRMDASVSVREEKSGEKKKRGEERRKE